jgi:phosphoenolpyruvate synthase/pyruvate phosphate dikinase
MNIKIFDMSLEDKQIKQMILDECNQTLSKIDKVREEKGDRYAVGYLKASLKYIKSLAQDA